MGWSARGGALLNKKLVNQLVLLQNPTPIASTSQTLFLKSLKIGWVCGRGDANPSSSPFENVGSLCIPLGRAIEAACYDLWMNVCVYKGLAIGVWNSTSALPPFCNHPEGLHTHFWMPLPCAAVKGLWRLVTKRDFLHKAGQLGGQQWVLGFQGLIASHCIPIRPAPHFKLI